MNLLTSYKHPQFPEDWYMEHLVKHSYSFSADVSVVKVYLEVHHWRLVCVSLRQAAWFLALPEFTPIANYFGWYTKNVVLALCNKRGSVVETRYRYPQEDIYKLTIIKGQMRGN